MGVDLRIIGDRQPRVRGDDLIGVEARPDVVVFLAKYAVYLAKGGSWAPSPARPVEEEKCSSHEDSF